MSDVSIRVRHGADFEGFGPVFPRTKERMTQVRRFVTGSGSKSLNPSRGALPLNSSMHNKHITTVSAVRRWLYPLMARRVVH